MVSLKCGRLAPENNTLKADNRKGNIQVIFDLAGLCHFIWSERDVSSTNLDCELDIVIIPGEAVFEMVSFVPPSHPHCHLSALTSSHPTHTPFSHSSPSQIPGRRAFILKFSEEPSRNCFFWSQEPDPADDSMLAATITQKINQPFPDDDDKDDDEEEDQLPGQNHDVDMLLPPKTSSSSGPIDAATLAAVLGNIMNNQQQPSSSQQQQQHQEHQQVMGAAHPSLSQVLSPDVIKPLLCNADMLGKIAPYLPEQHRNLASLELILSSPQFRHQLDLLTHALSTGMVDTSLFGLGEQAFGVGPFLAAIQRQADEENNNKNNKKDQDSGGDNKQ
jgi:26S proteasome regulatory subunit N13